MKIRTLGAAAAAAAAFGLAACQPTLPPGPTGSSDPEPATITVVVTEDGAPAADAHINAGTGQLPPNWDLNEGPPPGAAWRSGDVDATGTYTFDGPAGTWTIGASNTYPHPSDPLCVGYNRGEAVVEVDAGESTTVTIELDAEGPYACS